MTTSRTAYQNNYPSSATSVSTDMHTSWHATQYTSHMTSNGINGVSSNRSRPIPSTNGSVSGRTAHNKSDFYKNGRPAEVIVIDSQSPEPQPQSTTKRKRQDSISASTTVSAATKRARKSLNDEIALSSGGSRYVSRQKLHSVAWVKDERGVYRAQNVIVPKIEEVWLFPFLSVSLLLLWMLSCRGGTGSTGSALIQCLGIRLMSA